MEGINPDGFAVILFMLGALGAFLALALMFPRKVKTDE